jgi:hypothetical protein
MQGIQHPQCQWHPAPSTPHLIQHPQCQCYSPTSMTVVFSTFYCTPHLLQHPQCQWNSAPYTALIQHPQCRWSILFTAFYSALSMPVVFRILYNAFNRSFLNASGMQHPPTPHLIEATLMPVVFITLYTAFNSAPLMPVVFSTLYTAFNSAPLMPVVFSTLYTAFKSAPTMHGTQHPQCMVFSILNAA